MEQNLLERIANLSWWSSLQLGSPKGDANMAETEMRAGGWTEGVGARTVDSVDADADAADADAESLLLLWMYQEKRTDAII